MLGIAETLKEVLAIETQDVWIMWFALKANQRYWVLYHKRSVV
jgi:hypothetical protein